MNKLITVKRVVGIGNHKYLNTYLVYYLWELNYSPGGWMDEWMGVSGYRNIMDKK